MGRQGLIGKPGAFTAWHLRHRMTRRRAFLHLLSLLWVVQGIRILTIHSETFSRPGPSPLDWTDSHIWCGMWFLSAATGFWVSLDRRVSDAVGFAALIVPAIVWTIFAGYSLAVAAATGGEFGQWHNWDEFSSWALTAGLIRLVANWEDPPSLSSLPPLPPIVAKEFERKTP